MLERETELIIQVLTERTIARRDAISLKEVFNSPAPRNIKRYLQCEVTEWLLADLRIAPAFSRIPPTSRTSKAITESMVQPLAMEYVFPRKEFLATLENGVHFLENYLCRPHWTLENFVFERQAIVSAEFLASRLSYLTDYSYLCDLIAAAVRRKRWGEIHQDDFRTLLTKIDEQVTKNHTAKELAALAKPIYDFLFLEDVGTDRAISYKALLVFFDDKKLKNVVGEIEHSVRTSGQTELPLGHLTKVLERILGVSGEAATEAPTATPVATPTESVEAANQDASVAVPSGIDPEEPTKEATPETRLPEKQEAQRGKANPLLSLTFAGLQETQQTRPLADIASLISEEQRERFLIVIFKKDDAYFAGVVTALNKTLTWKDASLYLNQLYEINSLDPYADEVVEFTNIIHQRYETEGASPE